MQEVVCHQLASVHNFRTCEPKIDGQGSRGFSRVVHKPDSARSSATIAQHAIVAETTMMFGWQ